MYQLDPRWARIDMEMRAKAALEREEVRRLLRKARALPARQPLSLARLLCWLGAVLGHWGERLQARGGRLLVLPEDEVQCAKTACAAGACT